MKLGLYWHSVCLSAGIGLYQRLETERHRGEAITQLFNFNNIDPSYLTPTSKTLPFQVLSHKSRHRIIKIIQEMLEHFNISWMILRQ